MGELAINVVGDGLSGPGQCVIGGVTDSADVLRCIAEGRVTLGLVGRPPDDPNYESRALTGDRLVVVVPPGHEWTQRDEVTLDEEAKVPAGPAISVGHSLFYRLTVIGADTGKGRVDLLQRVDLLDADTGEAVNPGFESEFKQDVPAGLPSLTANGHCKGMSRAGRFRLRVTLTDRVGGKGTTFAE